MPGFLQALREITAEYGVLLVFDEVVTGFRLAYGGAQEYYGVVPDICTLGKVIGGGYPLSAVAGGPTSWRISTRRRSAPRASCRRSGP